MEGQIGMRYALLIGLLMLLVACSSGDSNDDQELPTALPTNTAPPPAGEIQPTPANPDALAGVTVGPEGQLEGVVQDEPTTPEPTAVVVGDDFEARADGTDPEVVRGPTGVPMIVPASPEPGAQAFVTEEVGPVGDFEVVELVQRGGRNDIETTIEIFADGRVVRDEQEGTVDTNTVQRLNQMIRSMDFYGMQGTFIGPPGDEGGYTYRLYVGNAETDRVITMQDNYLTPELQDMLGLIIAAGNRAG